MMSIEQELTCPKVQLNRLLNLKELAKRLELVGPNGEPRPLAALLPIDKAGLDEDFEVMAYRWLGAIECSGEIARADFARLCDHADEPEPDRIRQSLELDGHFFCLGLGEARFAQRGTTQVVNDFVNVVLVGLRAHPFSMPQISY